MAATAVTTPITPLEGSQTLEMEAPATPTEYFNMSSTSIQAADTLRTTLKTAPMMRSVRFHGPGDIRLDEVEEPVCGKGQVKVGLPSVIFSKNTDTMAIDETGICWDLRQRYVHRLYSLSQYDN